MERLLFKTQVPASLEEVKKGFNLQLFEALKPPVVNLKVERFDGCQKGDEVHLKVGLGIMLPWISHITDDQESPDQWYFIDEGHRMPPPLKKWKHIHKVVRNDQGCQIIDDINYSCGNVIVDKIMRPILYLQFVTREGVYQKIFGKVQSKN